MKIAIIGAGNVGRTLALSFYKKEHTVLLGVRDQKKSDLQPLLATIGNDAAVTLSVATGRSDIVFIATPWLEIQSVLSAVGSLAGKIVVDCTNPLRRDLSGLTVAPETSGAEELQRLLPEARVVKAFNTVGYNIMANPLIEGRRACLFYCGNNVEAKRSVRTLIEDVGFEAVDAGALTSARLLEPLALLWIQSASRFGLGREFAFGILRRSPKAGQS